MSSEQSIWYRLGYALERTRQAPASGVRKLATLEERRPAGKASRADRSGSSWPTVDQLVTSGLVAGVARVLDLWRPRRSVGVGGLVKAGLSGAAAALALEVVRPLLRGRAALPEFDEDTLDHLLAGFAQGLVYGGVVEPRLPGPHALKGLVYGGAEYAVDPAGGLVRVLGPHAPLKRVPGVGALLDGLTPPERGAVEHLAFGIALALIYGSSLSSNGILDDDEA